MAGKRTVPERDFTGKMVVNLIPKQAPLPDTPMERIRSLVPSPGDLVTLHDGTQGVVIETGELAHFGDKYRSIRVDFGDHKIYVAGRDIADIQYG